MAAATKVPKIGDESKELQWPYWPQRGSQTEMWEYLDPNMESLIIGYGGPRGGGKSFGARGFAATACAAMPLSVCIVRKTFEDVKKNHVIPMLETELRDYVDHKAVVYNSQDKIVRFPATGATITFTYCRNDEDLKHFQGQQFDLLIIEEAGQFTEPQIAYMISSNRSSPSMLRYKRETGKGYNPKTLCTFNWGGPGHRYLRRVFWDGQDVPHVNKPADRSVYTEFEDADKFKFIFAPMDQNKALMNEDPEYKKRLQLLPEKLRKAYIDGDPDAFTGTMFNIVSMAHEVDPFEIPEHWNLFGSLDPGTGDFCSFGLYAKSPNGHIYKMFTYYLKGKDPIYHRDTIAEMVAEHKWTKGRYPSYVIAGKDAFARQNKLGIQSHEYTWQDIFREVGLYLVPCNNARVAGAMALQSVLAYEYDNSGDVLVRKPMLQFFRKKNAPTISEFQSLESNPNRPDDIQQGPGIPDHAYDETRYAIMSAVRPDEAEGEDGESRVDDCYQREFDKVLSGYSDDLEGWEAVFG